MVTWSPLHGGLLGGMLRKLDEGTAVKSAYGRAQVALPRFRQALKAFEDLADDLGRPPAEIALAWVLSRPGVTSVVIGPRTLAHFEGPAGARPDPAGRDGALDREAVRLSGMEIIGRGFLARNHASIGDRHPRVILIAAGASSTRASSTREFERETALVRDVLARGRRDGKTVVFYSTASHAMYGCGDEAIDESMDEHSPLSPVSAFGGTSTAWSPWSRRAVPAG